MRSECSCNSRTTEASKRRPRLRSSVGREANVRTHALRVHELLATDAALDKLAARSISADEAGQVARNQHIMVRNPRGGSGPDKRRLLIGTADGGRFLTLVIERTIEPTTWLIVTGWSSTDAERNLLGR